MASLTRAALLGTALLVLSSPVPAVAAPFASTTPAPMRDAAGPTAEGDYVVVLKDSVPAGQVSAAVARTRDGGGDVGTRFTSGLRGFAARLSPAELQRVRADGDVAYVQPNRAYRSTDTQKKAPWGLDRVDQRSSTLSGTYFWAKHAHTGQVFVVDTGIQAQPTLVGARTVTNTVGGVDNDCAGHGTHVAGIIGDSKYGLAKASAPIGVKVLDCDGNGSSATVAAGLDYVLAHRDAGAPAVVNLSLGGTAPGHDDAVEAAVRRVIDAGITVVVAAGNSDDDACDYSPGLVPEAITVAASTRSDARSSFSNHGSCVDLYAPGSGIVSTWNTRKNGTWTTKTLSGTSMATPFVTAAALLYSQWYPSSSPAQVQAALTTYATQNVITGTGGSRGDLLLAKPRIVPPTATTHPNRIRYRTGLVRTAKICSPSGEYCLTQRASDHHLVLRRASDGTKIWSNGTSTAWTYVRKDSNLVSYDGYGHAVWDAGVSSSHPADLRVRDRGYLALVEQASGRLIWRSNKPVE